MQKKIEPYTYVRFRWWKPVDLEEVMDEFREAKFIVDLRLRPGGDQELSLYKDKRDELKVESDTLSAHISPYRAVLSQRSPSPLTSRDMELRNRVLELFPKNRPTPFPWEFSHEPKFELAETG